MDGLAEKQDGLDESGCGRKQSKRCGFETRKESGRL